MDALYYLMSIVARFLIVLPTILNISLSALIGITPTLNSSSRARGFVPGWENRIAAVKAARDSNG